MMLPKCLDLDSFKLPSCILFRRKDYSKRLKNIFDEFGNESIATLSYKGMMTSSKCLDLNCFESFSCILFRRNNFLKRLR